MEQTRITGAVIDRGVVKSVENGKCIINSFSNFGEETPELDCHDGVKTRDIVYYFMFPDGKGAVVGARKLTAGTGITIDENGVISATGGGGTSYDDTALKNRLTAIEQQESTWSGKQDAISDLAAIRSGAEKGAAAVKDVQINGTTVTASGVANIVTADIAEGATGIPTAGGVYDAIQDALGDIAEALSKL